MGKRETLEGARVLVTGATGLIGAYLCKIMVQRGAQVVAFVRSVEKALRVLPREVQVVCGDVVEGITYEGSIDYVVHAASPTASLFFVEHPIETRRIIVEGTHQAILFATAKNARLVYISSMEVYGKCNQLEVRETDLGFLDEQDPRSSYPLGKREAEAECLAAVKHGADVVIVRPVQTFGCGVPCTDNRVFVQFARAKKNGADIVMKTDGSKAHCYCSTDDCIEGLLIAMMRGGDGEIYNISNESTYCSIREMAEMLVGPEHVRVELDPGCFPPSTQMRVLSEKLRQLGWCPRDGLSQMYAQLISEM